MEQQPGNEVTKTPRYNYKNILCLAGAMLIFFPEHITNYWGNMSVYTSSYMYIKHGSTSGDSPWALSAYLIGIHVGMILIGYVTRVGRMTQLFIAILVFNMGIFSIYFIVEYGQTLVLFFVFGILGFSSGFVDSIIFKILSDISASSKGMYISSACSAFNFGPFFLNLFIGFYMNPDNVPPSFIVDGMAVFSESGMIDRTLSMITILGIICSALMFLGYCLILVSIRHPPEQPTNEFVYGSFSIENDNIQSIISNQDTVETPAMADVDTVAAMNDKNISTIGTRSNGFEHDTNDTNHTYGEREFTPEQTLKCFHFYVISLSFGACVFTDILLHQYYKSFGLIYINDDHLLIDLGSGIALALGLVRILWGLFLDKISAKTSQIVVLGSLSISFLLMYFTASINKYLYFVVTLLAGYGVGALLPTYIIVCLQYFGEEHFYKNFGILGTSTILFGFILPPAFDAFRRLLGMFGLFCCTSSFTTFFLILTAVAVPDVSTRQKK